MAKKLRTNRLALEAFLVTRQQTETLEFAGHSIQVVRRSRQKRLGVSVYPNGSLRVSANKSLSQKEILKFLLKHQSWIEKSVEESLELQKRFPPQEFRSGEKFSYLGCDYQLKILEGSRPQLQLRENEILFFVPRGEESLNQEQRERYFKKFKKSYREVAEHLMTQRIEVLGKKMKLQPSSVQFRGQKTIWGSCSPENKISLNFKLIVAPMEVIDYVIIHELAHIRHKNHSKNFWNLVEKYTEHRQSSKIWLKENQRKADFL